MVVDVVGGEGFVEDDVRMLVNLDVRVGDEVIDGGRVKERR